MKKLLSLLLGAVLLTSLVACGGGETSSSESATVIQPASSSEPEPEPLRQAYLTGLEQTADYPTGQRICAVMVSNIADSRPTSGLSQAKIVYEMKVEGGITRFMAVFEDYKTMPRVGPVRSARDQFLQMLIPSLGLYVHDGPNQNQPANWMLRDYDYDDYDLQPDYEGGLTWRDSARKSAGFKTEYTEYTDGEHITEAIERKEKDASRTYNSPIFDFVSYEEPAPELADGTAAEVGIIHSNSYRTVFDFNTTSGRYDMSMFNSSSGVRAVEKAVDENTGEQLAFDNVLVLFAPMTLYSNSPLVKVDYGNMGIGYYFNGGRYETIRWSKGGPDAPLRLWVNDTTETSLKVNPGTSYIAVVDDTELEAFYNNMVAGTSAENAGQGEVSSGAEEAD